jgi:hypothetical protein
VHQSLTCNSWGAASMAPTRHGRTGHCLTITRSRKWFTTNQGGFPVLTTWAPGRGYGVPEKASSLSGVNKSPSWRAVDATGP